MRYFMNPTKPNRKYLIIGYDKRLSHLGHLLKQDGYFVSFINDSTDPLLKDSLFDDTSSSNKLSSLPRPDIIVLPTPCISQVDNSRVITGTGLECTKLLSVIQDWCQDYKAQNTLEPLPPSMFVCGGCIPDDFGKSLEASGAMVFDFMKSDSFAQFNTIATAEGAIAEAITLSPVNLHDSPCLILGAGKCAKALALRLKALNTRPTMCARTVLARMEAAVLGMNSTDFSKLPDILPNFLFIFNTVPAPVLDASLLKFVHKECTIIDIASRPGGTDFSYCEAHKIRAKLCSSLPGTYAPFSTANELLKLIYQLNN